jgi:hypothetical protein
MQKKQVVFGLSVVLVILMAASLVMAQRPQTGGGQAGQRGQGMRGNFDPAQMQQRMMERMQEQLGMTATEIKAIQPLLTKVMDLRREAAGSRMRGMMGMMGGRGGRGGTGQQNAPAPTGLAKIQGELRTLLENDSATAAQIKTKLTAYRKARVKIQQDLAKAQSNLIKVLSVKQEAICVMSGYCD